MPPGYNPQELHQREDSALAQPTGAGLSSSQGKQSTEEEAYPPVGGGRAIHRVPRPGVGAERLPTGVAGMSLEGELGWRDSRGARRRGALQFVEPVTRPVHIPDKKGTSGMRINLISNLFKLECNQVFHLYQYHVDFNPEIPNPKVRKGMLYGFKDIIGLVSVFDGMALFLPIKLEKEVTEVFSKREYDGENVKITIKYTNHLPPASPTCLHLYNIVLKKVLTRIGLQQIGRNYYNPKRRISIKNHKLEIWLGYVTSILQFESSTMLIVDVSHKILSMETALDQLYDMYNKSRGPGSLGTFRERAKNFFCGQIVLTTYNNKTYRIDDIDWTKKPKDTFTTRAGTQISFQDYYLQSYNRHIQDPEQPLLIVTPKCSDERAGQRGPILLLPELCSITGLDAKVRENFHVMKDLAIHTRINPMERIRELNDLLRDINGNADAMKELSNWNLKLSSQLLNLTGRMLNAEGIKQNSRPLFYDPKKADWTRSMQDVPLNLTFPLHEWLMVYTKSNEENAWELLKYLEKVCPPMGMQIAKPHFEPLLNDNIQTFLIALKKSLTPGIKFVLCVLPTNRKDRYDAIKVYLCCDNPVPSQMILDRTLCKREMLMSVATKVAIQMNCKMGGEVWNIEMPMKNTMVVGIDTYHDSSERGRSVAGIVASTNRNLTKYYTAWSFQNNHEELVNGLTTNLRKCLQKYAELNGNALPDRVIVFRDGVGDGQLQAVNDFELPQIRDCFKRISPDYNPKFGFVVIKKRIASRFFTRDGSGNPPPGTVIDEEATRPGWFDFFVVSQSVRQGTVSPTHYNVIHDDNTGFTPDQYQKLTYKLCHLYYNWPGTIRVPAPCQYAHKVAFLVGQSLHKNPDEILADKLFYL